MRDKKGLSSIVTTVIIIGVVLVVLGIIAAIVFGFAREGIRQLSPDKYSVRVGIASAKMNFSTAIASIQVSRELGSGELVGLKFIFEDTRSSETYDVEVAGFDELEQRTFDILLNVSESSLNVYDVKKVSVAPIILLDSGEEVLGSPSEVVSNLDQWLNSSNIPAGGSEGSVCSTNEYCGIDYLVNGTAYCLNNEVRQYKKVFTCVLGFCDESLEEVIVDTCSYQCFDGVCIDEVIVCTPETVVEDCGADGFVGIPSCSVSGTSVVQNYKTYSCVNQSCDVVITEQVIEECVGEEICFNAECFIPLECTNHDDCDPGEICVEGECVIETTVNSGVIASIWPFSIGEYFDSPDLLEPENMSLVDYFIVFPGSLQEGCLKISEHLLPNATGAAPYVRLNETITNISSSDSFQVWETNYICSLY